MNSRGCGRSPGNSRVQGQGGRRAGGMVGYCVCPQCGQREPHERGVPCVEHKCPKCGITMTRQ